MMVATVCPHATTNDKHQIQLQMGTNLDKPKKTLVQLTEAARGAVTPFILGTS